MTIYIAFLRGINVGGHNKIKMAELKQMFEKMGFKRVKTYIQSGNVLFESDEKEQFIHEHIEHEIKAVFGFAISVVLRTFSELERITEECPFSKEAIMAAEASSEGESLYVALLLEVPSQEKIERLSAFRTEYEDFQVEGREVYLLLRKSIRNSKLAINVQKLGVPVTIRNWKTMNKLTALAKEIEA
ncbi:DUF1697 domain-containing protein [Viridibacillus sp. FSL R5-0477]|uniref:Cytoplasmic protein n=1 Tax=Viridibacillus arenosi FSL R5-213 TaxID=1227360 RepID=W4EK33_9BACL|nr:MULTISPECIES: DUF1697 domain-containing protein [Viridibacillus]ETT80943.1 hypothetical protein C176_19549 [Viridibacillus arenosi FSL R5-213]OMC83907.1 cytoplasmic protein [Viridibacillus sp. FSL H8-0123]OMC88428.1 cytoplasmic protein [Viridibacillus sp. FSL H7-0596]OMC93066.1 cytoplasmic protein [Viridibacillus arenosi]